MSSNANGIEFLDIQKCYGNVDVLRGASWNIGRGEIGVAFGANGAGKSTLLGVLSTLIPPDRGTIRIDGCTKPEAIRARTGFVSHDPLLTPALTVRENLWIASGLRDLPDRNASVERVIEEFNLSGFLDRPAGACSRGQAQRVSFASALISNPPILLLDEPFTGLDTHSRGELRERLIRWRDDGRAILLVTHELADGIALATRVGCLVRGKLFEPPAELLESPDELALHLVGS